MLKYLSYPLDRDAPRPPAIPAAELEEFMSVAADGASVQRLSVYSHTGTHVDTSAHVFEGGVHITEFSPDELVFNRVGVIDMELPDKTVIERRDLEKYNAVLAENEFILFNFGLIDKRARDPERFIASSPGFSVGAGKYIGQFGNIRGIGMDSPSVASIYRLDETMRVHNGLLCLRNGRFFIVEEMKLARSEQPPDRLMLLPWLVKGMHSGPCTVLGEYE